MKVKTNIPTLDLLTYKAVFSSFPCYNFPHSILRLLGILGTGPCPCSPTAIYFNHHDTFILASTQSCHNWREGRGASGSHMPATNTMLSTQAGGTNRSLEPFFDLRNNNSDHASVLSWTSFFVSTGFRMGTDFLSRNIGSWNKPRFTA